MTPKKKTEVKIKIAKKAIGVFNKRITDEIFLLIQNDKNLMFDYLRAIEKYGLDKVNQIIGKEVEKSYNLTKIKERENNPSSTLIKSHQKFK